MHAAAVPRRRFTLHGACEPALHHRLDPLARLPDAHRLLTSGAACALRAPPAGGRTTHLLALAERLAADGHPIVWLPGAALDLDPADLTYAEHALLDRLRHAAERAPAELRPAGWRSGGPWQCLAVALDDWRRAIPRPPVVIVDDLDRLARPVAGLLRAQLATASVPVVIAGVDDPRGADPYRLGRGAPTLRVPAFDAAEVEALYRQHAEATGQRFTPDAAQRAAAWSGGHPWLVTAIAQEIVEGLAVEGAVDARHVDRAAARLLAAWPAWLEGLARALDRAAVARVLWPLLVGAVPEGPTVAADLDAAWAAGLVTADGARAAGALPLAAAIRLAAAGLDRRLPLVGDCRRPDGGFDLPRAMSAFSSAWKSRGARIVAEHVRPDHAPVLAAASLMNRLLPPGAGRWTAAFGLGHLALRIELPLAARSRQRAALIIKVRRPGEPQPLEDGLAAVDRALHGEAEGEGALILFDGRQPGTTLPGGARLAWEQSPAGREVVVVRG